MVSLCFFFLILKSSVCFEFAAMVGLCKYRSFCACWCVFICWYFPLYISFSVSDSFSICLVIAFFFSLFSCYLRSPVSAFIYAASFPFCWVGEIRG